MSDALLCPHRFNREGEDALCVKEACMAWRTNGRAQETPLTLDDEFAAFGTRNGRAFQMPSRSYCGLAGDPS